MTISLAGATGVTTATGNRGTTSTTVAYVGVAAGRLGVITVCVKPAGATFPVTVTDGAGKVWGKAVDATGGTGTVGVDTGQVKIAKYIRVLDGTETGSVTITCGGSPTNVTGVMDTYASTVGGWRTPWSGSGSDASHGTTVSANTASLAQALTVGDWVHAAFGSTSDSTAAASAYTVAQTSTTFGASTARSRLGNQDGNDNAVFTWDAPVTAGGAATAVTLGFTFGASTSGPLSAMVLREVAALNLSGPTVLDAFTTGTSPSASWDNWGGAQVTLASQRMYVASTLAAGYYGAEFIAAQNLDGKILGVRLVDAGNTALASYAAYPVALQYDAANETYWNISLSGSTVVLRFWTRVANTYTARVVLPYVVGVHNYLGVGFSAGQLVGYTSIDGVTWTPEVSIANPYASTTANPFVMVGTDAAESSTTAMQIDDLSVWSLSAVHTAAASLPVTASLAAAATRTQPAAAATLAVTATLAAAGSGSKTTSAALAATAALTADAARTQSAAAALSVTAALSADVGRSQAAAAALSATATMTAAADRTQAAAAALAVTATMSAAATASRPAAAALAATASLTAAAVGTLTATPALTVTATMTAAATRTRAAAAALAVTATMTAAASRLQPGGGALSVTATMTAAAVIAGAGADASLPVTATLTASAERTAVATAAALAVTAGLTAAVTREQRGAAALAVSATLTAAADRITAAAAALAVTAALTAAATATRPAGAALALTATLTAAGDVGAAPVTAAAALALTATLTASSNRTQPSAAGLTVTAALAAAATRTARPGAALAVTATLTAGASITEAAAVGLAIVATLVAAAERADNVTYRPDLGTTPRAAGGRTPRIPAGGTARPASTRTPRLAGGRTDRL